MPAAAEVHPHRQPLLRDRAELILSRLDQLPTLPAVVVRLLSLTASSESSARDVIQVIEADASLTSAILKLVRRADLGVRDDGMTLERAVKLLGFSAVRNAALSVQVYDLLPTSAENEQAMEFRRELWKHNLAVACAAEMLAAQAGKASLAADAFVGGLLHDLGKIALDACLPKSYARVVERVEQQRCCINDVEHEILGIDHTLAGKRLAVRWQLPAGIVECIWLHHQDPSAFPSTVQRPELVELIHAADHLARRQHIGFSGYRHVEPVEPLAARLKVDDRGVAVVVAELPGRMEPLCRLLGIDESVSRTLYADSLAKANRELARANTELQEVNRRLDVRAACFDCVRRLAEGLTERDHVSDVCVAAAEAVRATFGVDGALVFLAEAPTRCLNIGTVHRDRSEPNRQVVQVDEEQNRSLLATLAGFGAPEGLIAAPDGCDLLWRRHAAAGDGGPLWLLPFEATDDLVGGVLFAADHASVDRFRPFADDCRALAGSIRLAIATARARAVAERLHEEALEMHRRFRAAQNGVVRARSVAMISEMAAGAAHELNNPLSVIAGRAQMQLQQCRDEELARSLQIIMDQARAASQIVTDLMQFAKPDAPKPAQQRLADLLEPRCQHWRTGSTLTEPQVQLRLADAEVTFYADADHVRTILDEVVANAIEACSKDSIRLQVNSPSAASDETVRIVVEDNGVGMTRECLEHAVDPFYSNRPAGRRRGLGLSRAYRLAEINGGRLWLDSTPDIGTTVTLELPARAPEI